MRNFLKIANRARREIGKIIDENYVAGKLAKRKGKCLRCGKCCLGCKYLDVRDGKCRCKVYSDRPWFCHKDFPIDKLDLKVFGVEKSCGYKF